MRNRPARHHAEDEDAAIRVARAEARQMLARAATRQRKAQPGKRHRHKAVHMLRVRNRLAFHAKVILAEQQIGQRCAQHQRHHAPEHRKILVPNVRQRAHRAKLRLLEQHADAHACGQRQQKRRVHRARPAARRSGKGRVFGRGKEIQRPQRQHKQRRQHRIGAVFHEILTQAAAAARLGKIAHARPCKQTGKTGQRRHVAAAQTQKHAPRATQKHQRAQHGKQAEEKLHQLRRSRAGAEIARHQH